jgi:hypothetical protein
MSEMYNIIKNVINGKAYELTTMLSKIKTLWVEGDISDAQKEELVELARANAKPENSYVPLQNQIDTLFTNVKEMGTTILDLIARIVTLEGGEVETEEPTEEYPPYVQPTGAHDAYKVGDKITYNGKKYECQKDNCVWNPDDYPQGWKLVEETE